MSARKDLADVIRTAKPDITVVHHDDGSVALPAVIVTNGDPMIAYAALDTSLSWFLEANVYVARTGVAGEALDELEALVIDVVAAALGARYLLESAARPDGNAELAGTQALLCKLTFRLRQRAGGS